LIDYGRRMFWGRSTLFGNEVSGQIGGAVRQYGIGKKAKNKEPRTADMTPANLKSTGDRLALLGDSEIKGCIEVLQFGRRHEVLTRRMEPKLDRVRT